MANGYTGSSSFVEQEIEEDSLIQNINIEALNIDVSDMPTAQTIRSFVVVGSNNTTFKIIVLQNPTSSSDQTKYYNWITKEFDAGHNSNANNLTASINGNIYNNSIIFPSGGGDYVIKLIAGLTNKVITKSISKATGDATVTFTPGTSSDNAANYATLPTSTSSGAVNSSNTFSFNWDVTNSTTDAKSHGFRLTDTTLNINDSYWYCETTNTVNGAVSSGTTVVLDALTDIAVGTIITGVSSGSLSGTPRISAIDVATKTITLDSAQTFADGITLTFKAYGAKAIEKAVGLKLSFGEITFKGETLTTTVRQDSDGDYTTSTTVRLGATLGISGGDVVKYKGEGVDNSSANTVTSVTPDPDGTDGDGAMVVTLTQLLRKGAVLTFSGCHKVVNFTGSVTITKYTAANKTIYLDLEKIITLGTAS
tara:strand:- start:2203 stop:3471 length:1269 start_codon:yes stop_codon:yes gene_type:complete